MIDPAMTRDFRFPPSRETASLLRQCDLPLAFHSDGKLDDVIPMLLELGVTAVHGCEGQANDLAHVVDRFDDDIALYGNMDVVFLNEAISDEVRAETAEMLRVGSATNRFIAGCNTSPQDCLPWVNYEAMARTTAPLRRPTRRHCPRP